MDFKIFWIWKCHVSQRIILILILAYSICVITCWNIQKTTPLSFYCVTQVSFSEQYYYSFLENEQLRMLKPRKKCNKCSLISVNLLWESSSDLTRALMRRSQQNVTKRPAEVLPRLNGIFSGTQFLAKKRQ